MSDGRSRRQTGIFSGALGEERMESLSRPDPMELKNADSGI